jgi:DNA-binding ferritin-like protein
MHLIAERASATGLRPLATVERGQPVKTVKEYLRHAEQSEALAEQAQSPEQKAQILQIAEMWRSLAKEREQLIQKKPGQD